MAHIDGTAASNSINGTFFDDVIHPGAGSDIVNALDGNDVISDLTNDTGQGSGGNDIFSGGNGNDNMLGGAGNDTLLGGADNDTLSGGFDNDFLVGGPGVDFLFGGLGADTYDFNFTAESGLGNENRDQISGFQHLVDKIDLFDIDANTNVAGNQAFSFIGSAFFSGVAGEMRTFVSNITDNVCLAMDVNGDERADMNIEFRTDPGVITVDDFFL